MKNGVTIRRVIYPFKELNQLWVAGAFIAYAAITFYAIFFNHEPWRDEFQIWLIACQSDSIAELQYNFRSEEHPKLWYYLLFLLSRISTSLWIKQVFTWLLSMGAITLLLFQSRFSILHRILLVFGYYMLFEYVVMTRVYALELWLISILIAFYGTKRKRWVATAQFLLLQTTFLGLVISCALWLYHILLNGFRRRDWPYHTLLTIGLAISLYQMVSGTLNWGAIGTDSITQITFNVEWLAVKMSTFYRGMLPLPALDTFHFWGSHLTEMPHSTYAKIVLYMLLSIVTMLAVWWSFREDKLVLGVFIAGALPMLLLFATVWHGSTRHHGHFFLLYILCYALLVRRGNVTAYSKRIFSILLIAQLPGGIYALCMDWAHPFSSSKEAASLITDTYNDYDRYYGTVDYTLTPIAYYAEMPFLVPESNTDITYIRWSESRNFSSDEKSWEAMMQLIRQDTSSQRVLVVKSMNLNRQPLHYKGKPLLKLLTNHNNQLTVGEWQLSYLASTQKALVPEEGYHIFEMKRTTFEP